MTIYITPYRRMATLRQAMDRLLEESLTESPTEREMQLAVDVIAKEEEYLIRALVPGLDAEDLNIEILNNTVSIRGEFKADVSEDENCLMAELPAGRFTRVITLPTALDSAKTEANMKNGVLTLRIPKAEAHRPKSIKVAVG